jgi:type IV secretory pathway VirB3-like protein
VSAQDLAPRSGATAAGMIFGVGSALAGLLYFGVGILQLQVGPSAGLVFAFIAPVLAVVLVLMVLSRTPAASTATLDQALCTCTAASGIGIVLCQPTCALSCKEVIRDA